MRNGECWQRPMLEPATDASDCSFWPTADTNPDGRNNRSASPNAAQRPTLAYAAKQWLTPHGMSGTDKTGKIGAGGEFQKQVEQWATPMAADDGHKVTAASKIGLIPQVSKWATPRATDGDKGGPNCRGSRGDPILAGQAASWPTPAARVSRGENSEEHLTNGSGRLHLDQLPNFVRFRFSLPAQPTTDGATSSPNTRNSRQRLNPAFACWLMGWPWWWTNPEPISFARSEMASYRFRLQLHLSSLLGAQDWHRDRDAA